jgi:protein arginine kinase activator
MTCDVCKTNEASVFLTQIVDGKMQKVNLCESCSKAKGVDDPTGFALADLLLGLGAAQEIERGGGGQAHRCPGCGFSQADFKKTGRLGCAQCYETFAEGLNSLLKAMHKGTVHTGKVPARISRLIERESALKILQRDLQKAVSEENYETAAQIRDQLRQLETSNDV